jgi:NarL family two-component system response regulator LiaR
VSDFLAPERPKVLYRRYSFMDVGARNGTGSEAGGGEVALRAIVADDDPFARRVIKDSLQKAGIVVIAEARNGRQAVELALYYRPDVVVMDVVMPELDGIVATRRIVKELPDQIVVILTGADDDDDEIGLQALRAGATGYLSKDLDIDALPRALEGARTGEAVISRRMTKKLIEHVRRAPDGVAGMRPVRSPLTAREWEVIDLLRDGRSTEAIADDLVLSIETVRSHVKNILRKLDVRSREDAVAAADRMRTAPPDGRDTAA